MIELTEVTFRAGQPIEGYGPGFFRLGENRHEGPLAILPSGVIAWDGWPDNPFLAAAQEFDVLLVGMGADIAPLPPGLRAALEGAGIGVDFMSTPSACRTYNVLLAEDRLVAIAALPV